MTGRIPADEQLPGCCTHHGLFYPAATDAAAGTPPLSSVLSLQNSTHVPTTWVFSTAANGRTDPTLTSKPEPDYLTGPTGTGCG